LTTKPQVTRRDSIHIDRRHHEVYTQLTVGPEAPFKTMKDLFMLAACVGYSRERRTPLSGQREIFRWPVFSAQEDVPILRAIAIAETGDTDVLVDQDQLLTIAEEYANSGVEEIKLEVAEQPGSPIESLIQYLLSAGER
jgi:dnd system-associated protein 4